jgi:hypothetical protein
LEVCDVAVQSENVERLMGWLAGGSPARSAHAAAEPLVAKLAALVFQGDMGWPDRTDRVDAYRDALAGWFAGDTGQESAFGDLTRADDDPGALIEWFLPVVGEWEKWAAHNESGATQGGAAAGLPNPNSDGTPGTEFYRYDEATGQYLYAPSADGPDWATYEQRRYSEPARDDNYGLDYRLDRTLHVYEWYDEAAGKWNDQTWADLYAARRHGQASAAQEPADGARPEWDENWKMFYRVGPGGVYEFADAVTPGDQSSGCANEWLSHEQVLQRRDIASAPPLDPEVVAAVDEAIKATFDRQMSELDDGGDLSAEDLAEVMDEVREIMLGESTQ